MRASIYFLYVCLVTICQGFNRFAPKKMVLQGLLGQKSLDVGEFENTELTLDDIDVGSSIKKFKVVSTISKNDMNEYVKEYKDEMKKRKVQFPGFRAGSLPPYVMVDVRKYIVCYGLEILIGQLCNINNLELCGPDGSEVSFGSDEYYQDIVKADSNGNDFMKQRDSWKEGLDFSFTAEFHAKRGSTDETVDATSASGSVIDTSAEIKDASSDDKE